MRLSALSDSELIRLYQSGKEECFEVLVHRHKDRIYSYLVLLLKNRDLAQDFFHDTLIKVIQSLKKGKYLEDGKFRPWAMRIAHNLVIDHFRKQQKMRMSRSNDEYDVFASISVEDRNVEEEMIHETIVGDMRMLVTKLNYEQREVLLMRIHAKMSFKEIAWLTGISINTALGRMRYALINLRKMMEEHNIKLVA